MASTRKAARGCATIQRCRATSPQPSAAFPLPLKALFQGARAPSARPLEPTRNPERAGTRSTIGRMAVVRLFAGARDAAGTGRDELPGDTVDAVLAAARERYGSAFDAVLTTCKIWVNGEPAGPADPIGATDELAVLPPVSGG